MGFLYIIKNHVNVKVYIGITTKSIYARWSDHKSEARRGVACKFYNAIRKYGEDQFWIEAIAEYLTWDELTSAEIVAITQFNSRHNGYNSTDGGDGQLGVKMSEQHKTKLLAIPKGRKHSPEWRKNIGRGNRGKVRSSETCRINSETKKPKQYTFLGRSQSIRAWLLELELPIKPRTVRERVERYGWAFESALLIPPGEKPCQTP